MTRLRHDPSALHRSQLTLRRSRFVQPPMMVCAAHHHSRQERLSTGAAITGIDLIQERDMVMEDEENSIQVDRQTARLLIVNDDLAKTLIHKAHHDNLQAPSRDLRQRMKRRTTELVSSQMRLIHCLGRAAEYRDNETGKHVLRVGCFSGILAAELGMGKAAAQQIEMAARLHDIGKLGVPDSILLKPGQLNPEEMAIMQTHAALGSAILSPQYHGVHLRDVQRIYDLYGIGDELTSSCASPLLKLAATIAATHHERWDGSGYPNQFKGDEIPLVGRIVAVADVFDALSTVRPYKPRLPIGQCVEMIRSASGTQFDPEVVRAFLKRILEIRSVYLRFQDQQTIE